MTRQAIINKGLTLSKDARMSQKQIMDKYSNSHTIVEYIDNNKTDTQLFMVLDINSKNLSIAFRGSQQLRDWLNDFNAFHMIYPYDNKDTPIRVHQGIMKCYLSVRDDIHTFLTGMRRQIQEVNVYGHSLGGALATLCLVDIQYKEATAMIYNNYFLSGAVSGNPKVFNQAGVESFNKRVPLLYRTHLRKDWVPGLPPTHFGHKLQGGYHHCGISNPIGPISLWAGIKYFFEARLSPAKLAENLTNHSIELYEKYVV